MIKTIAAAAILSVLGASASATTESITFQSRDVTAPRLTTTYTSNYRTAELSYTDSTGASFLAYCIEPDQSFAINALGAQTYTVGSFSGAQASLLEALYSSSYASATDVNAKAAFQLAVWEIVTESSSSLNVNGGSFTVDSSTALASSIATQANDYLSASASYSGPSLYTLTKLTNADYQDLVVASPVPEPQTWALLLAGLGAVGLRARRRQR